MGVSSSDSESDSDRNTDTETESERDSVSVSNTQLEAARDNRESSLINCFQIVRAKMHGFRLFGQQKNGCIINKRYITGEYPA